MLVDLPSGLCLRFEAVQTGEKKILKATSQNALKKSKTICDEIKCLTKFGLEFTHIPAFSLDQQKVQSMRGNIVVSFGNKHRYTIAEIHTQTR